MGRSKTVLPTNATNVKAFVSVVLYREDKTTNLSGGSDGQNKCRHCGAAQI